MSFPFYIASRYLFSRKSRNAINIISIISVMGVAVGTAALVIVLSVFNGFEGLLTKLNNSFDPDIKITSVKGKRFIPDANFVSIIKNSDFVADFSFTLEENALIEYDNKQVVAVIKGVDDNYLSVTGLDSMVCKGEALLYNSSAPCAIVGAGLAYNLGVTCDYFLPMLINVPSRTKQITGTFSDAISDVFNKKSVYASGFFAIQQDYDMQYLIMPIKEVRELLEYENNISAVEIKLKNEAFSNETVKYLSESLGEDYSVKDRNMQHEYAYKIMKSEKWAIFMILIFILLIASFNIIASITMLIIDKRNDISILRSMGAEDKSIRKIFFIEGVGISFIGALIGIIIGGIICWLQMKYGFVKLGAGGAFIIDSYPVEVKITDIFYSLVAVMLIGLFAAWMPVKFVTRKIKNEIN